MHPQMITQTMLRNSLHLEADVFEHAELEFGLGGREARYGKTLCVPFPAHLPLRSNAYCECAWTQNALRMHCGSAVKVD